MRIFEFQFNPKAKKDRFFATFSFEQKDDSPTAREQGSLYVVGELQNVLPVNEPLLKKIADLIFKEYTKGKKTGEKKSFSPLVSLKTSLRKANDFLAKESKNGNVDWLGNLHLAIVLLVPTKNSYMMYFTKVGGMKIWMARNGSLVNVGRSVEDKENAQGSLKIFGNVGSGKIVADDRIAILSGDLFDVLSKESLLQPMSQMKEEKQFKDLFKKAEKVLAKISGTLFFFSVESIAKETQDQPEERSSARTRLPKFSLPSLPRVSMSAARIPRMPSMPIMGAIPKISISEKLNPKSKFQIFQNVPLFKKALGLLFILTLILGIGFVIFKGGSFSQKTLEMQAALETVEGLQFKAEQALAFQNEKEANRLLQEAWMTMEPYGERDEFQGMRQHIERQLQELNGIEFIGNPELFALLDTAQVTEVPQRVLATKESLYFFSPFSSQLIALNIPSQSQAVLSAGRNLKFGNTFALTFLFFADPNILVAFNEENGWGDSAISIPNDFMPQGMATFASNFYLFDGKSAQVLKGVVGQTNTGLWIDNSSTKKPLDAISMTIDGNIWMLLKDGEIQRYFKGRYEESLLLNVFPALENPTKIYTRADLSYLYILDSANARVMVLTKFGDIIRQYQSPEFQRATDFAVSAGGDIVYILADKNVYRVKSILSES